MNLKTTVRVRPHVPHDIEYTQWQKDGMPCPSTAGEWTAGTISATISKVNSYSSLSIGEISFPFGQILGPASTQRDVFLHCGRPLVAQLFSGLNGCLFAYGQTGSGKTHSMLGPQGGQSRSELSGVIPQVAHEIFTRAKEEENQVQMELGLASATYSQFQVRVSYIETYQSKVYDLLREEDQSFWKNEIVLSKRTGNEESESAGQLQFKGPNTTGCLPVSCSNIIVTSESALMHVIARGSQRRHTLSTGVHDSSSRSHALLTIELEHRWRTPLEHVATEGEMSAKGKESFGGADSPMQQRKTYLQLVDLAGSEDTNRAHSGSVDEAGCAINHGLLVLGRVVRALAKNESHVPFRESALTRLLQRSLEGNCSSHLLACVSPASLDQAESIRTLRFATVANQLILSPTMTVAEVVEEEDDPMSHDEYDPDTLMSRRALWVVTKSFGRVFARVAGREEDPLVLYVHGSGPRNSSLQFNWLVQSLATVAKQADIVAKSNPLEGKKEESSSSIPVNSFYHVSIDCPGYGRSSGDKQSVRSYPGQLFTEVVQALGKRFAWCLVGSSQGACAVLNAMLEVPTISHYVAVCHPVGHDPSRYTRIRQPALLAFDTEDAGHPVSVGRIMRKRLARCHYYEFTESKEPCWLQKHFGQRLYQLFQTFDPHLSPIKGCDWRGNDILLPSLTDLAGGLHCWTNPHGREHADYVVPAVRIDEDKEEEDKMEVNVWEEESSKRSESTRRLVPQGAAERGEEELFAPLETDDVVEKEKEKKEAAQHAERERELNQEICSCCKESLFQPIRIPSCRHVLCGQCALYSLEHYRMCPVCQRRLPRQEKSLQVDQEMVKRLQSRREQVEEEEQNGKMEVEDGIVEGSRVKLSMESRRKRLLLVRQSIRQSRIAVFEISCRAKAEGGSGKYMMSTSIRQVPGGAGAVTPFWKKKSTLPASSNTKKPTNSASAMKAPQLCRAGSVISNVHFDINPGTGYKSAMKAKADEEGVYSLGRAMTRSYPCFITLRFKEELSSLPPLKIEYYTQCSRPLTVQYLIVQVDSQETVPRRREKEKSIIIDGRKGCVWIYIEGERKEIEYLNKGMEKSSQCTEDK